MKSLFSALTLLLFLTNSNAHAETTEMDLRAAVAGLEGAGVTGIWFKSNQPFSRNQEIQKFYLLKKLPAEANRSSPLYLLRLEHTRKILAEMLKNGVPIILGSIPEAAGVVAATFDDTFPLIAAALKIGGIQKKNGILITLGARRFTLAHEYQHWLDFESDEYSKQFIKAMTPFFLKKYFNQEQMDNIWRITWEIRGHAAHAKSAREDKAKKLPYLDRAGSIIPSTARDLADYYAFEEGHALSVFSNEYRLTLVQAVSTLARSKSVYSRFKAELMQFDFSNERENRLTFKEFLSK